MVDNLKIEYDIDRQTNVSTHPDPVLRAIETSKYPPSLLKFKEFMTDKGMSFSFSYTTQNLYKKKTCQENDIPLKTKSRNGIIFTFDTITLITHCSVPFFPQKCMRLTLYPFIKRRANAISKIIVLLVSFPFSPKFKKGVCLIKCLSKRQCLDFDKVTALNTAFFLWRKKLKVSLDNSGVGGMLLTDL